MTYLLTFSCYGQRLHGDTRGSIHKHQNRYGSRTQPIDHILNTSEKQRLVAAPYFLNPVEQRLVLAAVVEVCRHRQWQLIAAHIRTTHAHLIVTGTAPPEAMLRTLKAYSSRSLNSADGLHRPRWTNHGSTCYLWNSKSVNAAQEYVLTHQGEPMTTYLQR